LYREVEELLAERVCTPITSRARIAVSWVEIKPASKVSGVFFIGRWIPPAAPLDFLLSAKQAAAKRFLAKPLG
jgi:hypothetical protein